MRLLILVREPSRGQRAAAPAYSNEIWRVMETDSPEVFSEAEWCRPPANLVLARNEVHIWRASLELPPTDLARIQKVLSSDERARADRFHFERDRQRFTVARGFLRAILSLYLDCAPGKLEFNYAEHGKPSLADSGCDAATLSFNLAHSGTLAVYGITRQRAIGVDLEQIRAEFASEDIARRFFSVSDTARLLAVPASRRHRAFYDGWTRKEAFIKAKGTGLLLPLDQFDVALSPGEPAALLETRWNRNEASRWLLRAIEIAPDYSSAVAVEGHDWHLRCWQATMEILA